MIPPCLTLSIIRYGSRVKWSNPGNGVAPPLHLGVVAIEKGAFVSPSTMVANFTYLTFLYFGLVGRAFAHGPGDLGSIPGCVIPKSLKMVLDTSLLNPQQLKVRIKGKVEQPGKGVAPSPTPRCSSYQKGNLLVAVN